MSFLSTSPLNGCFQIIDDQSRLAISLDVSKFNPEELNVNVEGRTLTVEGKQEIEEENGYSIRWVIQSG